MTTGGFKLRQSTLGMSRPVVASRRASKKTYLHLLPAVEEHTVHAEGPDADRIVLVGPGRSFWRQPASAAADPSADVGLAGHLARELLGLTGRGASVDIHAQRMMSPGECLESLDTVDFGRYDALVLMLGTHEGRKPISLKRWRRHLTATLDRVYRAAPVSLHVFVMAVPSMDTHRRGPILAAIVGRRLRILNSAAKAVCQRRTGVTPIAFDQKAIAGGVGEARTIFGSWAAQIAPSIRPVLDRLRD